MSESRTSWETRLEEKMKALEDRLEEMGRRLERKAEKFEGEAKKVGQQIEDEVRHHHRPSGAGFFWGIVFVVAGVIWLGNQFGWFYYDVPWAALFLIAGGLYLLVRHWDRPKQEDKDSL